MRTGICTIRLEAFIIVNITIQALMPHRCFYLGPGLALFQHVNLRRVGFES